MSLLRRKGLFESTKVLFLPIAAISPNPDQPRTCFSREGLEELAASIQELGVLQPLSVRRSKNGGYELISGERRLRASRMAGLTEVPCILVSVDSQGSSLLALVENLQRRDLDFLEEAMALDRLIHTYDLSQEEAARRIGKSQSAVANKLRLLKLSPRLLDRYYRLKAEPRLSFAGQMTGVEGYVESAASGFLVGVETARRLTGRPPVDFPRETAIGALGLYVSNPSVTMFQPMNINFGIMPPLDHRVKGKRNKNAELSARSLAIIDQIKQEVREA